MIEAPAGTTCTPRLMVKLLVISCRLTVKLKVTSPNDLGLRVKVLGPGSRGQGSGVKSSGARVLGSGLGSSDGYMGTSLTRNSAPPKGHHRATIGP